MSDRVQDLLFRADFFINSHTRLRSVYQERMPTDAVAQSEYVNRPLANLAILNANLYFFEAVSCLASLLRDNQTDATKNEISFQGLAARLPEVAQAAYKTRLKGVFAEYKKSGLEDMRDKYVDHKDLN